MTDRLRILASDALFAFAWRLKRLGVPVGVLMEIARVATEILPK